MVVPPAARQRASISLIHAATECAGAERHDAAFLETGGESLCECW
jgi:hypothetical protein